MGRCSFEKSIQATASFLAGFQVLGFVDSRRGKNICGAQLATTSAIQELKELESQGKSIVEELRLGIGRIRGAAHHLSLSSFARRLKQFGPAKKLESMRV